MTIILPKDYHAHKDLENSRIICIDEDQANKMDIRALRIGILNIMPEAESYEYSLLHPLGRSVLQIVPIWIKLRSHKYGSTSKGHLDKLYKYFEDALKEGPIDGMIITGAPVEQLNFEDVRYWNEIKEILEVCRQEVPRTLGICWGGLALGYLQGIPKENYKSKLFGVFETYNQNPRHEITGALDDVFWMPQSRHAGIRKDDIEAAAKDGRVNLLAYSPETEDYPIFETADKRFIINLGHFEYESKRIIEEMLRDQSDPTVPPPKNFDADNPLNRWRGQRNEFYGQFVRNCYEQSQLHEELRRFPVLQSR